jgi:hypothetical protein
MLLPAARTSLRTWATLLEQVAGINHQLESDKQRVFCRCSKDKPEDLGYPPVEPAAEKPKAAGGEAKAKPNVLKQLLNNVLKNPFIWGMALTYFFIYIVRQVRTYRSYSFGMQQPARSLLSYELEA